MKKLVIFLFFSVLFTNAQSNSYDLYVVNKGDSFKAIAQQFNMTVDELLVLNAYKKDARLLTGVSLFVKKQKKKEQIKDKFHLVKRHETLYSISKQHHLTVGRLKKLNHLRTNEIRVGQYLRLR
jgi:LysM repeat protein